MKKLTISLLVLVLGVSAYAMSDAYISGTWQYKITVNVETPDGVKSGSAIRQLSHSASSLYIDLPDVGRTPKGKGEAVVIDLGSKGTLFGLVSTDMYRELYETFPFRGGKETGDDIRYYNSLPVGKKGALPRIEYPRFVMFKDINDPTSVDVLNPDNFAETLGNGYAIEIIEIEITDKSVMWTIGKILPWLNGLNGSYLHGGSTSKSSPFGLHAGNFRKGK